MKTALCIGINHANALNAYVDATRADNALSAAGYNVITTNTFAGYPTEDMRFDVLWFSGEASRGGVLNAGCTPSSSTFTLSHKVRADGWIIFDCCHIGSLLEDHGRVNAIGCLGMVPNETDGSVMAAAILPLLGLAPFHRIVPAVNPELNAWSTENSWMYPDLELITGRL